MFNKSDMEINSPRAGVHRTGRTLYFFDDVDEFSVMEAIRHLHQLEHESRTKTITVIINSPGGSCYDGLALYDVLRSCHAPITTIGCGIVASMGFIIYLAGDKRLSLVHTRYLNHQVSSNISGKASDIEIERAEVSSLEEIIVKIVSERTGMKTAAIKKAVKVGDNYFNSKDAVKNGIIHEIIEYVDKSIPKETTPVEVKE